MGATNKGNFYKRKWELRGIQCYVQTRTLVRFNAIVSLSQAHDIWNSWPQGHAFSFLLGFKTQISTTSDHGWKRSPWWSDLDLLLEVIFISNWRGRTRCPLLLKDYIFQGGTTAATARRWKVTSRADGMSRITIQTRVIVFCLSWTTIDYVIIWRKRHIKCQTQVWGGVSSKQCLLSLLLVICDNPKDFMRINWFLLINRKVTETIVCALREARTGLMVFSYSLRWWWRPGVMMTQGRSHLPFIQSL